MANKQDYIITVLGYKHMDHSNFWPWYRFTEVFRSLGYQTEWEDLHKINKFSRKKRIYICWNEPTTEELIQKGYYRSGDVLIQKLTSLGKGDGGVNWGTNALNFFKNWSWPPYKRTEKLYDQGYNIYAFGCRTDTEPFPEKHRICEKIKDRLFWVPWGPCLYSKKEIDLAKPIMTGFKYDIGYVGMKWGVVGRGNVDTFSKFIQPLLNNRKCALAGAGNPMGTVTNDVHKNILKQSRLCPIVNAPSWQAERGVQDRFWTVFATGRFGVVDTDGIYEFFNKDEVVCEEDPNEYVQKSLYYLKHIDKQLPYIQKIQNRIKNEYNWENTWKNILESIISDQ